MRPITITLKPSPQRGFMRYNSPYDERLVALLKEWPGSRYAPGYGQGTWLVPKEMESELRRIGKKWGVGFAGAGESGLVATLAANQAYPYQQKAASQAISEQSWLFNFGVGVGKSLAAILALMNANLAGRILIVRPALAWGVWEKQLEKWWPGHPEFQVLAPGINPATITAPIVITSYALMPKLPVAPWAAIVLDESAHIAHGGKKGAQRTKHAQLLRKENPSSMRLCLSATPVMTRFEQIHSQLDWLWPTRFAHWIKFTDRYGIKEDTGYVGSSGQPAMRLVGLNPEHQAELEARLQACSSRVTKAEAAPWLPKLLAEVLTIQHPKSFDPAELTERFLNTDVHNLDATEFLKQHSTHKIGVVSELAVNATENEDHICVLTHLRETARQIRDEIYNSAKVPVLYLEDGMDSKRRMAVIENAIRQPKSILVTTFHKIREAIDLTAFTTVYFAEMHPSPGIMEQVFGRFNRLNSTQPTSIYLVCLSGSYEERIGAKLVERAREFKGIYKPSTESDAIMEAFEDRRSDADFRNHLAELCT